MSRSIACIDYRDGKVFIAKRQNKGDMGGRWEFPGGKLDDGEDNVQAIAREMMEEFGVKVTVSDKIYKSTFTHKGNLCYLDAYLVTFKHYFMKKPFVLTEHTDYRWAPLEEIPTLNFVDSDLGIYPAVVKKIKG